MLRKRKMEGEFAILCSELKGKFVSITTTQQFTILLSKVKCDLTEQNTAFREAVTLKQKLAVCLRLLKYYCINRNKKFLVVLIKRK